MDDLFGSAHELEQSHIQEGARDGKRDGMRLGLAEGRALGLQKGYEIGMEVGHYAGCVRMWRALQQQQPGSIPAKVERSIAAMEECLLQYPLYQPQDEELHELLEQLRGKYKTVLAGLGLSAADYGSSSSSIAGDGGGSSSSAATAGGGKQPVSLAF
ncbi:hypothetical protein COO60DRAFT_1697298 [Scenedesmus sp. NREL 46B-D3]|nr:hypothetical protein COO60DRAFT_1697298 [Scenedesmus sp. NREL 46B-D3]